MARPVGSTTRPQIRDYVGKKDIERLVNKAIEKAREGDAIMLKFLLEQYFGKAPQPITGEGGGALEVQIVNYANTIQLSAEGLSASTSSSD